MRVVGRIKEIWRYPVKSMRGEQLAGCRLGELGVPGDRGWAVRDEDAGEIRGAKKFPQLMQCEARYRGEPDSDRMPPVSIRLPDGRTLGSDAADVHGELSALLGTRVTLHPRRPADDLEHYRRAQGLEESELRAMFGLQPDEPLPDLGMIAPAVLAEITEYTSPLGTYFDAYPIHILTTSWLQTLGASNPASRFEAARFRPNLVIESDLPGFPELDWCGRQIRIGEATLACDCPTIRCIMTSHQTGDLPRDIGVLQTIARESNRNVGAYATIARGGMIRTGDPVELD